MKRIWNTLCFTWLQLLRWGNQREVFPAPLQTKNISINCMNTSEAWRVCRQKRIKLNLVATKSKSQSGKYGSLWEFKKQQKIDAASGWFWSSWEDFTIEIEENWMKTPKKEGQTTQAIKKIRQTKNNQLCSLKLKTASAKQSDRTFQFANKMIGENRNADDMERRPALSGLWRKISRMTI